MQEIKFSENIISLKLDTALIELEDSATKAQVKYRSGICAGMAGMAQALGFLTQPNYSSYMGQVIYIVNHIDL